MHEFRRVSELGFAANAIDAVNLVSAARHILGNELDLEAADHDPHRKLDG